MEKPTYKSISLNDLKEEIENDKSVTMVTEDHPNDLAIKYAASYGCLSVKATLWKGRAEYYEALARYYEERITKANEMARKAFSATEDHKQTSQLIELLVYLQESI